MPGAGATSLDEALAALFGGEAVAGVKGRRNLEVWHAWVRGSGRCLSGFGCWDWSGQWWKIFMRRALAMKRTRKDCTTAVRAFLRTHVVDRSSQSTDLRQIIPTVHYDSLLIE